MNIVLSQAIVSDANWNQGAFPPLGLMYLSASLKDIPGVTVRLVDGFGEGLSINRTVEKILALEPDLVGVSITSRNALEGLEVVQKVKEARPQVYTVCGGIHAGLFDDLLLKDCPYLDMVIRGEAEQSFAQLVRRLMRGDGLEGVPGLSLRVSGKVVRGRPQFIPDLDSLPFPDRALLDFQGYGTQWYGFDLPNLPRMTTAFASRGCPHSCVFCADATVNSRYRVRSPENIVQELLELKEQGYKMVIFFDDNLTGNISRVNRLCNLIIENRLDLILASTGMPHLLPDETLALMKRAGFLFMFVGVESGSDAVLSHYRKPARRQEMLEGIRRAQKANLFVIASFITGLREETEADHQATKDFLRQARPFLSEINPLMVHPGSALWEEIHRDRPPKTLRETLSRPVSRFPNQKDRKTIKFRERDFRRAYSRLWWNPRMVFRALAILCRNRSGTKLAKTLLKNPSSILQLWRGGRTR